MDLISTGLDPEHELTCLLHDASFLINLSFEAKLIDS